MRAGAPSGPAFSGAARERRRVMPKLVQISPESAGNRNLIAVDKEGEVWRGDIKRDRIGQEEYIEWRRIRSDFPS